MLDTADYAVIVSVVAIVGSFASSTYAIRRSTGAEDSRADKAERRTVYGQFWARQSRTLTSSLAYKSLGRQDQERADKVQETFEDLYEAYGVLELTAETSTGATAWSLVLALAEYQRLNLLGEDTEHVLKLYGAYKDSLRLKLRADLAGKTPRSRQYRPLMAYGDSDWAS